jgi:hypothetical protein
MNEPKRYDLRLPDISYGTEESPNGEYVCYEDYASLKAEAEQYRLASIRVDVSELHAQFKRALLDEAIAENARLKAEVERLTAFTTRTIIPNEKLQEQVERLTKAGDEVILEWSMGDETDALNFMKAFCIWNTAKEGKQLS